MNDLCWRLWYLHFMPPTHRITSIVTLRNEVMAKSVWFPVTMSNCEDRTLGQLPLVVKLRSRPWPEWWTSRSRTKPWQPIQPREERSKHLTHKYEPEHINWMNFNIFLSQKYTCQCSLLSEDHLFLAWMFFSLIDWHGTRPTNGCSIEFKIQSQFGMLCFQICSIDHNEILHMSRQSNFLLWPALYAMNKSITKCHWISK